MNMPSTDHDFLSPPHAVCSHRTLNGCGAPIRWVTLSGHPHPIDPEPVAEGNLAVVECETGSSSQPRKRERAVVVLVSKQARDSHEGPLYLSHFATCPHAHRFRKHTP